MFASLQCVPQLKRMRVPESLSVVNNNLVVRVSSVNRNSIALTRHSRQFTQTAAMGR